jgi:HK97 family phage prohead protease
MNMNTKLQAASQGPANPPDATEALRREFRDRVINLSTGQPGLRGTLAVEAAAAPTDPASSSPPVIDFVASDATLDRAGEIIEPAGWRLDNYRHNPVFQNAHNYGNILFTLGRAQAVEVRAGRLFLRVLFAVEINPLARVAYQLYRGGFLNAVSVGFVPLRWETGNDRTPWRRRFVEQELLEVSAVSVPANPNALALALKSGAVAQDDLRAWHALITSTLADRPAPHGFPALVHQARALANSLRQ